MTKSSGMEMNEISTTTTTTLTSNDQQAQSPMVTIGDGVGSSSDDECRDQRIGVQVRYFKDLDQVISGDNCNTNESNSEINNNHDNPVEPNSSSADNSEHDNLNSSLLSNDGLASTPAPSLALENSANQPVQPDTTSTLPTSTNNNNQQPSINIIPDSSCSGQSAVANPLSIDSETISPTLSASSSSTVSFINQLVIEDNCPLLTCDISPPSDSSGSSNSSSNPIVESKPDDQISPIKPESSPRKLADNSSRHSSSSSLNRNRSNDNFDSVLQDFGSAPPPPSPIEHRQSTPRGSVGSISSTAISAASVSARLKTRKRPGNFFMNMIAPTYQSKLYDFRSQFAQHVENIRGERLIGDYACAYHKDFLIQGRIYITKNYIIFYANWIGFYEKTIALQCKEIESVSKGYTAIVIPNAIHLTTTAGVKHVFASFVQRDKTFQLLQKICARARTPEAEMTDEEIRELIRENYGEVPSDSSDDEAPDGEMDSIGLTFSSDSNGSNSKGLFTIDPAIVATEELKLLESVNELKDGDVAEPLNDELPNRDDTSNDTQSEHQDPAVANTTTTTTTTTTAQQAQSQLTSAGSSSSREPSPHISLPKGPSNTSAKPLSISLSSSNSISSSSNSSSSTSSPTSSKNSTSSLSPPVSPASSSSAGLLGPISCLCTTHAKTRILHCTLPFPVDQLFETIFREQDFCQKLHHSRRTYDLKLTEWMDFDREQHKIDSLGDIVIAADPIRYRTLSYTINVNTALLKTAFTQDSQFVFQQDPGRAYVVASQSRNIGIPYADSFFVNSTTCLVADPENPRHSTSYSVHYNIVYVKANWSLNMLKSTIEKSSLNGLTTYANDVINFVPKYFKTLSKGREKSTRPSIAGDSNELRIVPGSSEDEVLNKLVTSGSGIDESLLYRKANNSSHRSSVESSKISRDHRISRSRAGSGAAHSLQDDNSDLSLQRRGHQHHPMFATSCNLYLLVSVLTILVVMVIINVFLLFHISDIENKLSQLYQHVTQATNQQQHFQHHLHNNINNNNNNLLANQFVPPEAPPAPTLPPSTEL